MIRPKSIRLFEILWWSSTAFWALGRLLAWRRVQNSIAGEVTRRARADEWTQLVAQSAQWFVIGFTLLVTLLVWWLVARRASRIGKWATLGLAVWSGAQLLLLLFQLSIGGANLHPLSQGALVSAAVLAIASAVVLFRADARTWFGEGDEKEEELPA